MIRKTHIALGAVSMIPLVGHVNIFFMPIGLIGAICPDFDYMVGLKHRGITHTILALITTSTFMLLIHYQLAIVWAICYGTHLIGDSITKTGIPALYPASKKYYGLKLIKTKGAEDMLLFLMCMYIISEFIK